MALSFIGAMNVGSIALNFDEQLETNYHDPEPPYFCDQSYEMPGKDKVELNDSSDSKNMKNKKLKVSFEIDIDTSQL